MRSATLYPGRLKYAPAPSVIPRNAAGAPGARFAKGDEERGRAFDGFFLGPGFPRAYREAREGPLKDET
jgi:hypothetical protein